jgi:alkanesulfonate monooxygenase SsuD/methylene tetrahydromethanopterin reductase-like flavin-dependent oxidoreductase (luciferase family)
MGGRYFASLRFSNAVYIAPTRPLLQVAKLVATASVISDGRVSLAVAAGWMREEFEVLGQDSAIGASGWMK